MVDEMEVDHYIVLRLPSGEEGTKLSQQEISRAYRLLALELHPDKRPNDPNAHTNFRKLKESYDVLSDEGKRRLFENAVRAKLERDRYDCQSRTTMFDERWSYEHQRRTKMFEKRRKEKKTRGEEKKARVHKIKKECDLKFASTYWQDTDD